MLKKYILDAFGCRKNAHQPEHLCDKTQNFYQLHTVMKKSKILKNSQNVIKMSSKCYQNVSKVLKSLIFA